MEYIAQLCSGKKSRSYDGGTRARGFKILHPSRWTMLSLGRCLLTTNISHAIIRCTVPPTVSLAWSQGMPGTDIICKGIKEIPLLQCTPPVLISWVRMGYPCLCLTTRYYLLVHPFKGFLYRTMYVPLFNYIRKMAKLIRRLKKCLAVLAGLRRNF